MAKSERIQSRILLLRCKLKQVTPSARERTMAYYREQMALARSIEASATAMLHRLRDNIEQAPEYASELAKLVAIQRIMRKYGFSRGMATMVYDSIGEL